MMKNYFLTIHLPQWAWAIFSSSQTDGIIECPSITFGDKWMIHYSFSRITRQCIIAQLVGEYLEKFKDEEYDEM